jgi:hypothetical protein
VYDCVSSMTVKDIDIDRRWRFCCSGCRWEKENQGLDEEGGEQRLLCRCSGWWSTGKGSGKASNQRGARGAGRV